MYKFVTKVHHDNGVIRIVAAAQSAPEARKLIMEAERCPEGAIKGMTAVDAQGFERVLDRLDEYVVLPVPVSHVRHALNHPLGGYHKPTMLKVRIVDRRWRRVYEGLCNGTKVHYVKHTGGKTCIQLPVSLT